MHFHRRGHNRLSSTAILYNKNGELFINAVRSTSFVLSKDELAVNKDLHCFAPEFLLSKGYSKSLKNDVWALGCLAILMLTGTPLSLSQLHPYNFQQFG
jgi:serine/threonine protein kinase